jgi:hypothetical protein
MTADESTASTAVDALDTEEEMQLERRRTLELAKDEGHDADIPSNIGVILDEKGEERLRRSVAEQRRKASAAQANAAGGADLEKEAGIQKGAGEGDDELDEKDVPAEADQNIVWWTGPDDPLNPYNWPTWRKVVICGLISSLTFITPLASCEYELLVPQKGGWYGL